MQRHEFLAALHETLKPRGYLEVGVQTGASLRLARCPALGIDPRPVIRLPLPPSAVVAEFESDQFFALPPGQQIALGLPQPLDLVFVDGLHLHEQALRDFYNAERWSNPRTVVVFDDVLPRSQAEATREPVGPGSALRVSRSEVPFGDWVGDVWKVHDALKVARPSLTCTLVDVEPTGALLVTGLNPHGATELVSWASDDVPAHVLSREFAVPPGDALKAVAS